MRKIYFLILLIAPLIVFGQSSDETNIRKILDEQTSEWNGGNIEGFMKGYWKSDSLMFIGSSGISWGWTKALENYKKHYPDTTAMGKLSFDVLMVKKLSDEYFYVVGKWSLTRTIGNVSGYYDLVFRKIKGQWLIVADHSS